jgi:hypothetical protein
MTFPTLTLPGNPLIAFAINVNTLPTGQETIFAANATGSLSFVGFMEGQGLRIYMGTVVINTTGAVLNTGLNLVVLYYDTDAAAYKMRINGVSVPITVGSGSVATTVTAGRIGIYPDGSSPISDSALGALLLGGGNYSVASDVTIQKTEGLLAQYFSGTSFLPSGAPYRSIPPQRLN